MGKYDAQARYKREHTKRVPLDMSNEDYAILKAEADNRKMPVNTLIKTAIWQFLGINKGGKDNA